MTEIINFHVWADNNCMGINMGRYDTFRSIRLFGYRVLIAVLIAAAILIAGIIISDRSYNYIISGVPETKALSVQSSDTQTVLNIMNLKLEMNTRFISEDIERITRLLAGQN